jgi:hypothetical protein
MKTILQDRRDEMQDILPCLFWSQISLRFNLPPEINAYKIILFDLEFALDGIYEEGQLAAPLAVLLRGALDLPERELDADLRQNLTRFLQIDVMRLSGAHSFLSSAALRYGPILYSFVKGRPPATRGITSSPKPLVGWM